MAAENILALREQIMPENFKNKITSSEFLSKISSPFCFGYIMSYSIKRAVRCFGKDEENTMKVFAYTVHNLFDHNVGSHLLEAYQEMATCMDDSYFLGYEAAQNDLFLYEQLGDPCRSLMSFIYGDP